MKEKGQQFYRVDGMEDGACLILVDKEDMNWARLDFEAMQHKGRCLEYTPITRREALEADLPILDYHSWAESAGAPTNHWRAMRKRIEAILEGVEELAWDDDLPEEATDELHCAVGALETAVATLYQDPSIAELEALQHGPAEIPEDAQVQSIIGAQA